MTHQEHTLLKKRSFSFQLSLFGRVNQTLCQELQLQDEIPQPSLLFNIITQSTYLFYLEPYSKAIHFFEQLLNNHRRIILINFSTRLAESLFYHCLEFPKQLLFMLNFQNFFYYFVFSLSKNALHYIYRLVLSYLFQKLFQNPFHCFIFYIFGISLSIPCSGYR